MKHYTRTMRLSILTCVALGGIALSACGDKQAAPPPATPESAAPTVEPLAPAPEPEPDLAAADPALDVAVNEPLPPFEDDSGIILASKSVLRASDAALAISGDVLLYEAPDGSRLLRLENLQSPKDLRIDLALSRVAAPASAEDARTAMLIGALKGPSGSMNYLLESNVSVDGVRAFVLLEHGQPRVLASAPFVKPQ